MSDAFVAQLERLSALHTSGALSDEEFQLAKSRLLAAGERSAAAGATAKVENAARDGPPQTLTIRPKGGSESDASFRAQRREARRQAREAKGPLTTDRRRLRRERISGGAGSTAGSPRDTPLTTATTATPSEPAAPAASQGTSARDVITMLIVAVAATSFTLRILQFLRISLMCPPGAQPQPARCRVAPLLVSPLFFTLAVLVIGRCFGCVALTRKCVEKVYGCILPPQMMDRFRQNVLGLEGAEGQFRRDDPVSMASVNSKLASALAQLPGSAGIGMMSRAGPRSPRQSGAGASLASPSRAAASAGGRVAAKAVAPPAHRRRGVRAAKQKAMPVLGTDALGPGIGLRGGGKAADVGTRGPVETADMKIY